jgi:23S rRNA pseudouridine2605 synthase
VQGRGLPGAATLLYYALNKPVGVISTLSDPQGRRTLRDFLPPGPRVFPVGRLDADTSGLLILTNDGDLAHHLMHPRYGVEKHYRVRVDREPNEQQLKRLETGVRFEPGRMSAPARVRMVARDDDSAVLGLSIHEGRFRQVRRMCEAVGLNVLKLHRAGYGPVRLGPIERGMWRELSAEEVERLRAASARPRPLPAGAARLSRFDRRQRDAERARFVATRESSERHGDRTQREKRPRRPMEAPRGPVERPRRPMGRSPRPTEGSPRPVRSRPTGRPEERSPWHTRVERSQPEGPLRSDRRPSGRRERPAFGPSRGPGREMGRDAERGPSRGPSRGPMRGPSRGPTRGPARGAGRGPSRGPMRGPARGAERGPSRGPARGPARSSERGPFRGPARGPARGVERGPSRGPMRGPVRGPSRGPTRGPARSSSFGPTSGPRRGPSRGPARGPSRGPARGPARGSTPRGSSRGPSPRRDSNRRGKRPRP